MRGVTPCRSSEGSRGTPGSRAGEDRRAAGEPHPVFHDFERGGRQRDGAALVDLQRARAGLDLGGLDRQRQARATQRLQPDRGPVRGPEPGEPETQALDALHVAPRGRAPPSTRLVDVVARGLEAHLAVWVDGPLFEHPHGDLAAAADAADRVERHLVGKTRGLDRQTAAAAAHDERRAHAGQQQEERHGQRHDGRRRKEQEATQRDAGERGVLAAEAGQHVEEGEAGQQHQRKDQEGDQIEHDRRMDAGAHGRQEQKEDADRRLPLVALADDRRRA